MSGSAVPLDFFHFWKPCHEDVLNWKMCIMHRLNEKRNSPAENQPLDNSLSCNLTDLLTRFLDFIWSQSVHCFQIEEFFLASASHSSASSQLQTIFSHQFFVWPPQELSIEIIVGQQHSPTHPAAVLTHYSSSDWEAWYFNCGGCLW